MDTSRIVIGVACLAVWVVGLVGYWIVLRRRRVESPLKPLEQNDELFAEWTEKGPPPLVATAAVLAATRRALYPQLAALREPRAKPMLIHETAGLAEVVSRHDYLYLARTASVADPDIASYLHENVESLVLRWTLLGQYRLSGSSECIVTLSVHEGIEPRLRVMPHDRWFAGTPEGFTELVDFLTGRSDKR